MVGSRLEGGFNFCICQSVSCDIAGTEEVGVYVVVDSGCLPACLAAIHRIPVLAVEEDAVAACSCKPIRRARWERAILALV